MREIELRSVSDDENDEVIVTLYVCDSKLHADRLTEVQSVFLGDIDIRKFHKLLAKMSCMAINPFSKHRDYIYVHPDEFTVRCHKDMALDIINAFTYVVNRIIEDKTKEKPKEEVYYFNEDLKEFEKVSSIPANDRKSDDSDSDEEEECEEEE